MYLSFSRKKLFTDIERLIFPQKVINRVVFDLDSLLREEISKVSGSSSQVTEQKSKVKLPPASGKGNSVSR